MAASLLVDDDLRPLTEAEAEEYVAETCFRPGPPGQVGAELERTVHDRTDPTLPVAAQRVRAAIPAASTPLPAGGAVSLEPGGQLELSSRCCSTLPHLVEALRADLAVLDACLDRAGLCPGAAGLDPHRPPERTLDHPRYAAMERRFDQDGPSGRRMMCSTASVQVCLDAGVDGAGTFGAAGRWRRLHDLAPVLVAMFANSPFAEGRPTGWRSGRQAAWLGMREDRTRAPDLEDEPRSAWAAYALSASVLCVPREGDAWDVTRALPMRDWLRGLGPSPVTRTDLDYHLTTLFPPVRPRGFLELRVVDAQAADDWEVVVAVVTALMEDPTAVRVGDEACAAVRSSLAEPVGTAARHGLDDPVLRAAARACMDAAEAALPRLGADTRTRRLVRRFAERYTYQGRCPADARLHDFFTTGRLEPDPRGPED